MREGSVLVLYTDGITEAESPAREHFGLERLRDVVAAHRGENASSIHHAIRSTLESFIAGAKHSDDTTLVVMKF